MLLDLLILPGFEDQTPLVPPIGRVLTLPALSRAQLVLGKKLQDEYLDYGVDWAARLVAGETITASSATVTLGTIVLNQFRQYGTAIYFWLDGGDVYRNCLIECTITTSYGRELEEVLLFGNY